ncbi:hypothetical protein AB1Y20_000143 [Prymnesium parvum]|uniref:Uncharacterized protein n=1 Tax=Prymnesium parvum TaxID=97485 RepID=A0AB34K425_PRYPA
MAARGGGATHELRVLRSPHHGDRRSTSELAAIDTVDALHAACIKNHRSLIQMSDGKYVLARRADEVDGALGVWVSTNGADDLDEVLVEEEFQRSPFQGGREDSPRLIILGFLQGRFTHGYTGRDYWVTDVEANDCGVRTVTIAPSPSGAISQGRAVRRSVDEFISAFLSTETTPVRPPAPATRAAGSGNPVPQLALTVATLDVSQRPIAKALRLWPRWQTTAPSLATSYTTWRLYETCPN